MKKLNNLLLGLTSLLVFNSVYAQPNPCQYTTVEVAIETQIWANEISWELIGPDGNIVASGDNYANYSFYSLQLCLEDGCYVLVMNDSFGDGWNGAIITFSFNGLIVTGPIFNSGNSLEFTFGINDPLCGNADVLGCTDPNALNYNPLATIDDGSCFYNTDTIPGCTDPFASNYNPFANFDDGSCVYDTTFCIEGYIDGIPDGSVVTINFGNFTTEAYTNGGYFWADLFGITPNTFVTVQFEDCNGNIQTITAWQWGTTGCLGAEGYWCDSIIYGCTDPNALNYNPQATIDDGSCIYDEPCDSNQVQAQLYICTFSNGNEVGFELIGDDGSVVFYQMGFNDSEIAYFDICLEYGVCYTANMYNLNGPLGWYGGYFWINTTGIQLVTGALYEGEEFGSIDFSLDGNCGEVYGCTDPNAVNYNPDATIDDGSCVYPVENDLCADATPLDPGTYLISNIGAYENEGQDGWCWAFGAGEAEQTSIWYSFTTPEYPVNVILETFSDGSNTLTDTQFGLYLECDDEMIYCDGNSGQGLFAAFYFQCGELEPNTTYLLQIDGYAADEGTCYLNFLCDPCDFETYGCTDPNAINYDPFATIDDGSCIYITDTIYGCTDPLATNYNPLANIDDGSCVYDTTYCIEGFIEGIPDGTVITITYWNFILEAVSNNGYFWSSLPGPYPNTFVIVQFEDCYGNIQTITAWQTGTSGCLQANGYYCDGIFGCTDPNAINYDPFATIDDGSCIYDTDTIYGCTDPFALNYNPLATIDDGSCIYDTTGCDANEIIVNLITQQWGNEISWDIIGPNGDVVASGSGYQPYSTYSYALCLEDGCYTLNMYDSFGDGWNEGVIQIFGTNAFVFETTLETGQYGNASFGINDPDCGTGIDIYGCTDPNAINYDPYATIDDGSCEYDSLGGCVAYFEIEYIDNLNDIVYMVNLSTGPALEYYWDFGDGNTSNEAYPQHQYEEDGTYVICLTVWSAITGGICQDTYCYELTYEGSGFMPTGGFTINIQPESPLGLNQLEIENLVVFPNPASDILNVQFETMLRDEITLILRDVYGRVVSSQLISNADGIVVRQIELSNIASGNYLLELRTIKSLQSVRFNVTR